MADATRRRWLRYAPSGERLRWRAQPLLWGLGYLAVCAVVQTVAALLWVRQGEAWFDTAAGQQAPVLLVVLAGVALVGLSPKAVDQAATEKAGQAGASATVRHRP